MMHLYNTPRPFIKPFPPVLQLLGDGGMSKAMHEYSIRTPQTETEAVLVTLVDLQSILDNGYRSIIVPTSGLQYRSIQLENMTGKLAVEAYQIEQTFSFNDESTADFITGKREKWR